jgi:hypothetical protein
MYQNGTYGTEESLVVAISRLCHTNHFNVISLSRSLGRLAVRTTTDKQTLAKSGGARLNLIGYSLSVRVPDALARNLQTVAKRTWKPGFRQSSWAARGFTMLQPQFNFLKNPRSFSFIRGHFPPFSPCCLVPACPAWRGAAGFSASDFA